MPKSIQRLLWCALIALNVYFVPRDHGVELALDLAVIVGSLWMITNKAEGK